MYRGGTARTGYRRDTTEETKIRTMLLLQERERKRSQAHAQLPNPCCFPDACFTARGILDMSHQMLPITFMIYYKLVKLFQVLEQEVTPSPVS